MEINKGKLVGFHGAGSDLRLTIDFESETIWATQKQISELFGVDFYEISRHINNIYISGELSRAQTVKEQVDDCYKEFFYNLDLILSVGYRVNSGRATEFRKWATGQLKELITHGFAIDDNRFASGQLDSFQKLVERVRSIRTSESNLFKQITDIFATSVDYNKNSKEASIFFATIQNKFHFATHGHTAAELISKRADASKINMGLTSFKGGGVTMAEAKVAKNYLSELEVKKLELLSEQFLSFAELRYYDKKTMTMRDWNVKLDEFLIFNEKEILKRKSNISTDAALVLVGEQLSKFKSK